MFLSASHEVGGGRGPGGEQEIEGGTGGDRAARWDREIIGSEVIGRTV